jgi:hypothetical protein
MAFKYRNRLSSYQPHENAAPSLADVNLKRDADIVAFVEHSWRSRDKHRLQFERQWLVNIAMYLGFQYLEWDATRRTLQQPPAPPWRVRLAANRLQGTVRKIVSKILRQSPEWVVVPATEDTDDEQTAMVSEKVLRHYWESNHLNELLMDAFTWMSTCGNVFLRVLWDTTKGEEFEVTKHDLKKGDKLFEELKQDKRKKTPESIRERLGDATIEVCSPFEIDVDPTAERFRDKTYLIQSKLRSRQYIRDRYDVDLGPLVSDEHNMTYHIQQQIASLAGPSGFATVRNEQRAEDMVLEHVIYIAPRKDFPRGMFAVVAGNKVLRKGTLELGEIPFVHLQEVPTPGRLWGSCVLEQAISLQIGYNRARSQIIESVNMMSRPKYLNPEGSGVLERNFTSEPGEVIEYVPGLKPELMPPAQIPAYVMENVRQFLQDINDVTGIHEVSQGQVPGGVRAGIAIAQLQEQDDSTLAPMLMCIENNLAQVGHWILKLYSANVSEERLIKITGKNREFETQSFKGKDLTGKRQGTPGINYFDVRVQMGSQLPFSKAARQQFVIELMQFGLLNPQENPQDKEMVFEMLQMGSEGPAFDEGQKERANAHRENTVLVGGDMVVVNPWDIDEIHVESHRGFQRTPFYIKLIERRPEVNQYFEMHIQQHVDRAAAMQAGPQQAGPAASPAPAALPTPPAVGGEEGLEGLAELIAMQEMQPAGEPQLAL